jgi:hypothetical protein
MEKMTYTDRREKWKSLIDDQEQSGLTQEAFCKQHNLNQATFTYYRGMFRGRKSVQPKVATSVFTPINITKATTSNEIRITLPNGFLCTFPVDINPNRIKEIVGNILSC